MTTTPNLSLPYLAAGQAQKHVTHNDALRMLDALVMLTVLDRDLSAPPPAPADGARYIVSAPGTGAFAGRDNEIAHYVDGGWLFHAPQPGWTCFVADESALLVFDGAAWVAAIDALGGVSELQDLVRLGVGTQADAANPFAAKLNSTLWTARTGAEGGDGSLRFRLNKEAAANTLSLLLQTGFSGRAEIGLTGDDDFHFKVSADGATWHEAILIDKDTGQVSFPQTAIAGGREVLTADRTYYVRSDGADSNDGLADSPGGAFLTIQKAIDTAAALDLGVHNVTIAVAAGTYAGAVLKKLTGAGSATILGDSATPANVHVSVASGTAIEATGAQGWMLDGLKLSAAGFANLLQAAAGSDVKFQNLEFGATTGNHIRAESAAIVTAVGNYRISSGAACHVNAALGGIVNTTSRTITLTGSPAFSSTFVRADRTSVVSMSSMTFSGGGTGKRYDAAANGVIYTNGAGAGYLPGDTSGTTATGGQYI